MRLSYRIQPPAIYFLYKGVIGATFLGLIPYLDRAFYTATRIDLLGVLYPGWILALFAALGAAAGAIFGRKSAYGGVISCLIGLSLLTGMGFVGEGGGDGNIFYVFAMLGSTVFVVFSLVAAFLRQHLCRSSKA